MPYGLFDYIPDSTIHTMGLSPMYDPNFSGTTKSRDYNPTGGQLTYGSGGVSIRLDESQQDVLNAIRGGTTAIKTGSTLTNPYTLRMPEDPTQQVTTAAIYEEGNVPSKQSPPSGGGSCPPGYAPVQSTPPTPRPPVAPAPVPNPSPVDPRTTFNIPGVEVPPFNNQPAPIITKAAICSEDPRFCPTFTTPGTNIFGNQELAWR